jgi:hypothetical protein
MDVLTTVSWGVLAGSVVVFVALLIKWLDRQRWSDQSECPA